MIRGYREEEAMRTSIVEAENVEEIGGEMRYGFLKTGVEDNPASADTLGSLRLA